MNKIILLIFTFLLVVTGCNQTKETEGILSTGEPTSETMNSNLNIPTTIPVTPETTISDATITATPEATVTLDISILSADATDSTETENEIDSSTITATLEATTSPDSTVSVVSADDPSLVEYMRYIIPIIESHLATRDNLGEADTVFSTAPYWALVSLEATATYRDALAIAKENVESELRDASAITQPHRNFEIFHSNLVTALTREQEYITKHHAYYSEVVDKGTSDDALYSDGVIIQEVADDLWWNTVIPEFDRMLAALDS